MPNGVLILKTAWQQEREEMQTVLQIYLLKVVIMKLNLQKAYMQTNTSLVIP